MSALTHAGHCAVHWSSIGSPGAPDSEILKWARKQEYIVFTHDLDFGDILAATDAEAPSVLQIRSQDPTPDHCAQIIISTLNQYKDYLQTGALISVDEVIQTVESVRGAPEKQLRYRVVEIQAVPDPQLSFFVCAERGGGISYPGAGSSGHFLCIRKKPKINNPFVLRKSLFNFL